ncbi:MAG TPA: SDR family oxidoreductase [Tepidisphaeraceae bacterium]|jgi:NAD(P)-dependent dehydrogenase (short-subunit alcohol dehydrogenase family)
MSIPVRRSSSSNSFLFGALAAAVGITTAGYFGVRAIVRNRRHFDLTGKTAIVTGGSRGIGLAIAQELIARGARVTICARDAQELAAAEQELTRDGGEVLSVVCDVTQADEIANVVQQTRARFGPIDVLVNNAGIITVGPMAHMKLADFRDAMDVHFEAPLLFILDCLPEMRQRGSGRIVNIASFGGKIPTPHLAAYAASKHALVGLSESLRTELVHDGIYVTTVCPGLVRSGSAGPNPMFKGDREAERAWFVTGDVTPGMSIHPQRLARQVVDACQAGDADLITPAVASLQSKLHGLVPGVSTEVATLINRLLPKSVGPEGDAPRPGHTLSDEKLPAAVRAAEAKAERESQATNPNANTGTNGTV